jgi:hypothetical protein
MPRRRPARITQFRAKGKTNGFEAFHIPSKHAGLSFTVLALLQFIALKGGIN